VAVLVTSDAFAEKHDLKPTARIRSFAVAGVDPEVMGVGRSPPAARRLHAPAWGSMTSASSRSTRHSLPRRLPACASGHRPAIINLDGGGISIGHPLGATGARITAKAGALLQREQRRFGLPPSALAAARASRRSSSDSEGSVPAAGAACRFHQAASFDSSGTSAEPLGDERPVAVLSIRSST
jgi:acetyl-CoA acyltransferase